MIRHNTAAQRFEAGSESNPAHLDYRMRGDRVDLVHTEAPPEYQGQGLGGKLAAAALEWARASGKKVIATCPFVKGYVGKHPEFEDLL